MKVSVSQIYIEPEATFPFSYRMQVWLSGRLTTLASPGPVFLKKYGEAYELIIRLSAKAGIRETEIRGPSIFRKSKDVEYVLFLPFDAIRVAGNGSRRRCAELLLDGVKEVFARADVTAKKLSARRSDLIERLATDDRLLEEPWVLGSEES